MITRLKPGQVRVQLQDGEEEHFYVTGGVFEVQPHVVTVLADTAMRAADLDEAAAVKAKEEAEQALADRERDIDFAEAQAELARAMAQIQAIARLKKQLKS